MTDRDRPVTDAELVAFVDNRLSPERREAIVSLARQDSAIASRIAVLTDGTPMLGEAFRPLLTGMPPELEERLRQKTREPDALWESTAARPTRRWFTMGIATAASFVIGGLAGGLFMQRRSASSDWREAVAQYHALYGMATTAGLNPSPEDISQQLSAVSQALGRPLPRIAETLASLNFKRAQVLEFEGAPLIQIVFETADKVPVAFCLKRSRDTVRPPSVGMQQGLALASWTRDGVDELIVARLPPPQILELAQRLAWRT
jgi:anti-sigma factor RsiW